MQQEIRNESMQSDGGMLSEARDYSCINIDSGEFYFDAEFDSSKHYPVCIPVAYPGTE